MALFWRSKKTRTGPEPDEDPTEEGETPEHPDGAEQSEDPDPDSDEDTAAGDPSGHLAGGPYDEAEAPQEDRIDLGGLLVPSVQGMELRMEMDQRSRAVTGANLVIEGSSLQVQAFAAPKSRGLWEDVRASLRDSVTGQGGTAETRPGPFGQELIARLPVKRADGRTGYRPVRFIGVDGPRWFVRAILSGKALGAAEQSRRFENILSRIVVVRGTDAMAPQELIPLNLPGQRPGVVPTERSPLEPLGRGPEITEVG